MKQEVFSCFFYSFFHLFFLLFVSYAFLWQKQTLINKFQIRNRSFFLPIIKKIDFLLINRKLLQEIQFPQQPSISLFFSSLSSIQNNSHTEGCNTGKYPNHNLRFITSLCYCTLTIISSIIIRVIVLVISL